MQMDEFFLRDGSYSVYTIIITKKCRGKNFFAPTSVTCPL